MMETLKAYSESLQRRLKGGGRTGSDYRNDRLESALRGACHVLACKLVMALHKCFKLRYSSFRNRNSVQAHRSGRNHVSIINPSAQSRAATQSEMSHAR